MADLFGELRCVLLPVGAGAAEVFSQIKGIKIGPNGNAPEVTSEPLFHTRIPDDGATWLF
jgi:hypothetical protein